MTDLVPVERIEHAILTIRGQRVMLDSDLAELYGVETRALNQAVRRNLGRFPEDFMFRLTAEEKAEVITICDHLSGLRFSAVLPFAFTEHGAVMLSAVLKSPRAVEASITVARAFVRMRHLLALEDDIRRRLDALEARTETADVQLALVYEELREIRSLMAAPITKAIGFRPDET